MRTLTCLSERNFFLIGQNARGKALISQVAHHLLPTPFLLTPTSSVSKINGAAVEDIASVIDTAHCRRAATGGPSCRRTTTMPPRSATDVRTEKTPFIARVWMVQESESLQD